MSEYPSVSCLCPTYGRPDLLEEMIECFLRQDYKGQLELLILNDCIDQTFSIADPRISDRRRITIFNATKRYSNFGHKRNASAYLAAYPWLMTWDDDDLQLPWAVSESIASVLKNKKEVGLLGSYFIDYGKGDIKHSTENCPSGCYLIKADTYWSVGGVPPLNSGQDHGLLYRLRDEAVDIKRMNTKTFHIYRWTPESYHLSAFGMDGDKEVQDTGYALIQNIINKDMTSGKIRSGDIELKPHWREDWLARCAAANP